MIRTGILTAIVLLPGTAIGQEALPENGRISGVTLFEAGLAEIGMDASGLDALDLMIPLKDVDDVLKSLIVTGSLAGSPVIRLAGESPVEDAFMASPVKPGDLADMGAILNALPGIEVELVGVSHTIRTVRGRVMGVSAGPGCVDGGTCVREVTLMEEDGSIVEFPLDDNNRDRLRILDERVLAAMRDGMTALSSAGMSGIREVSVDFGAEAADAGLSYVIEAPIWKTAYRTQMDEDGGVSLQAWAVIENATPTPWKDITLTLSSGNPVTLDARLHQRQWPVRDIHDGSGVPALAEKRREFMMTTSMADSMMEGVAMSAAPAPMAEITVETEMSDSLAASSFTFPGKVSLAPGEMISLPFLAGEMEAKLDVVWSGGRGDRSGSPDMTIRVANDLPVRLPAGIMTIRSATTGYAGDASFPMLPPGGDASVTFGRDGRITVDERTEYDVIERGLTISRGVMTLIDEEVRKTAYRISAPGNASRDLVIDHPWQGEDVKVTAEGADAGTVVHEPGAPSVIRYGIVTAPGEVRVLTVEERRTISSQISIGDADPEALAAWSLRAEAKDRDRIDSIAAAMRERASADMELNRLLEERRVLVEEQRRLVESIEKVADAPEMRDRYLRNLSAIEDQIEENHRLTGEAMKRQEALAAELTRLIEA